MKKNFKMDFLCVGFAKCGTSSLHAELKKNSEIYVPEGRKETFFITCYKNVDNPTKVYQEKYYPKYYQKDAIVGAVEPSYYSKAEDVYNLFGKNVKLIFVLREPCSACFSIYRMKLRRVPEYKYYKHSKLYKKDMLGMFEKYLSEEINKKRKMVYLYDQWIKEYLKYYKKDQIKFVIFEELIKNPTKIMNEIQDFIGVKNKIEYKSIRRSNEGNKISKDGIYAYINYTLYKKEMKHRAKGPSKREDALRNFVKKIQKYTLMENNFKASKEEIKKFKYFFEDSINETSKLIGRNLNKIWYK